MAGLLLLALPMALRGTGAVMASIEPRVQSKESISQMLLPYTIINL